MTLMLYRFRPDKLARHLGVLRKTLSADKANRVRHSSRPGLCLCVCCSAGSCLCCSDVALTCMRAALVPPTAAQSGCDGPQVPQPHHPPAASVPPLP